MLLLNPASNPIVKMFGAVKGVYRILGANSSELIRGEMIANHAEGFQIPPSALTVIDPLARTCEFILETNEEKKSSTKTFLIVDPPEGQSAQLRDRMQWLVDGPTGVLWRLDERYASVATKVVIPRQSVLPNAKFPPSLIADTQIRSCNFKNININDVAPVFNWLADALTLRFERRSSLTFDLLDEHVFGAAVAAEVNGRDLRKLLFYGQWLTNQTQRDAPYSSAARAGIEMVVIRRGENLFARVIGMLSQQSIFRMLKLLKPEEYCWRIQATNDLSIGCVEIKISSEERATELSNVIGARIVTSKFENIPLAALTPLSSEIQVLDGPLNYQQAEKWDWGWSPVREVNAAWPVGELRRVIIGPKAWHWIKLSEDKFAKTDSVTWAWMVSCAVRKENIARLGSDGSIVWSNNLISLPASLTRWWMLFGGGCIAMSESGQVVFTGLDSHKAANAMGWQSDLVHEPFQSISMDRRKLALKLRNSRDFLVT